MMFADHSKIKDAKRRKNKQNVRNWEKNGQTKVQKPCTPTHTPAWGVLCSSHCSALSSSYHSSGYSAEQLSVLHPPPLPLPPSSRAPRPAQRVNPALSPSHLVEYTDLREIKFWESDRKGQVGGMGAPVMMRAWVMQGCGQRLVGSGFVFWCELI